MKKVFLSLAVVTALASCKKDHTCTCTSSTTTTTTTYKASYKSNYGAFTKDSSFVAIDTKTATDAFTLSKVSKKTANADCPKSSSYTSDADNTENYDQNGVHTASGSLKMGNTIHEAVTKTCTLN